MRRWRRASHAYGIEIAVLMRRCCRDDTGVERMPCVHVRSERAANEMGWMVPYRTLPVNSLIRDVFVVL